MTHIRIFLAINRSSTLNALVSPEVSHVRIHKSSPILHLNKSDYSGKCRRNTDINLPFTACYLVILNHLQQFNDITVYGMIKHLSYLLSVHKMPVQLVAVAVDGSVLKLSPFASFLQDNCMIIFNQPIYIIYRWVYTKQSYFDFHICCFLGKWWKAMKLKLTSITCVLERCQVLLGKYIKFPEPWVQEKLSTNRKRA